MINHWWVTRPKRKLLSVPEDLAVIASGALNQEWRGQRMLHLQIEDGLEQSGLKRIGERRDRRGGGARTYVAWLKSLGLLFTHAATGKLQLTLAGEELLAGREPTLILTKQIFKYQFPSPFSLSRGVNVNPRFRVRPFCFLFRLLLDDRIQFLSQEEIAKIVITEAETESDACYETVVNRIVEFRSRGDACLPADFEERYSSSRRLCQAPAICRLNDVANTLVNWMEYTQYIIRGTDKKIRIAPECRSDVESEFVNLRPLIDQADNEEVFQRKFGVDPWHNKDTRNFANTQTVTAEIISKAAIRRSFLGIASRMPVLSLDSRIISTVSKETGLQESSVGDYLAEMYPRGAFGSFMPSYNEMAFGGRERATEFEIATAKLFHSVFGFATKHVGPVGLSPDVVLVSDKEGYQAIIDNKAYSEYSITNDHKNRMVVNYIPGIDAYSDSRNPIAFFSYIAGGFARGVDSSIREIYEETGVHGSAIAVYDLINLMQRHLSNSYSHLNLRDIFSVNRKVLQADFIRN